MAKVFQVNNLLLALTVSVFVVALAGCGNQAQESTAAPPPDSGTALQPTEPPIPAPKAESVPPHNNQKPTESVKAPEGLPLPIYTGFKVVNTMRTQTGDFQGMQVEITGDAPLQTVSDFYEAEFKKLGLDVRKLAQKTSAGEEALVLGQSDKITAGVSATRENNQTRVVLSWSEKK
ncbi:MAG: hypothetical protein KatS3mg019_1861 [Fimbriimonadales bacterium]|nr:MAG: hypothetical protein KatS3mg019_1861 [Fimbriimonadales bacterium]